MIIKFQNSSKGFDDWQGTSPNGFNNQLTSINGKNDYLIKPMIRLVKIWNAKNGYIYPTFELEKMLLTVPDYMWFSVEKQLKDYFFTAVLNLEPSLLPNYKANQVNKAQSIIQTVKRYEKQGFISLAVDHISHLF